MRKNLNLTVFETYIVKISSENKTSAGYFEDDIIACLY